MREIKVKYYAIKPKTIISKIFTLYQIEIGEMLEWASKNYIYGGNLKKCLFTELNDKNGEDIYTDCDIFKFKYMEQLHKPVELIGIMIWNDSELRYEIEVFNNSHYCVLSYLDNGTFYDFEIIGNKFENPELLK